MSLKKSRYMKISAAVAAVAALGLGGVAPASAAPGNGNNGNGNNGKGNQVNDAGVLGAHLLDQELNWEDCDFGSESLNERFGAIPGTACADVTVPRDWHDPTDGNTITLRVSKTETSKGNPSRQGIALVLSLIHI